MVRLLISIFMIVGLISCKLKIGNSLKESSSSSGSISLSGTASKGIISNGKATAFAVENGSKGRELGSAQTDSSGLYDIKISNYKGAVIVEVVGGSYEDEATGVTVQNDKLRAVISSITKSRKVSITPLTEIAVKMAGSNLSVNQINNSNAAVAVLIGGADITLTQPVNIKSNLNNITKAQKNYTMILAAISQMVEDDGVNSVAEAIQVISNDFLDDGNLHDSHGGGLLTTAIDNFIASPENQTGLNADDIDIDESIAVAKLNFVLIKEKIDFFSDDEIDETITYTHDDAGNVLTQTWDGQFDEDTVSNGTPNFIRYNSYNGKNQLVIQETDVTADGIKDLRATTTYDTNGNISKKSFDSNIADANNILSGSIYKYTYNDNNQLIKKEYDTNGDGNVTLAISYSYDENGNVTLQQNDQTPINGSIDYELRYEYDSHGNQILFTTENFNTALKSRSTFTYNDSNQLLTKSSDSDADGDFDYFSLNEYDEFGKLIINSFYIGDSAQGTLFDKIVYTYDEYGNLITKIETGDTVKTSTYTWSNTTKTKNSDLYYSVFKGEVYLGTEVSSCLQESNQLMAVDTEEFNAGFAYEICIESNMVQPSMPVCEIGDIPVYKFDFDNPSSFENGAWDCYRSVNIIDYHNVNNLFDVTNEAERLSCENGGSNVVFNSIGSHMFCSDDNRVPVDNSPDCSEFQDDEKAYTFGLGDAGSWACQYY
jgi:hypothetical protein